MNKNLKTFGLITFIAIIGCAMGYFLLPELEEIFFIIAIAGALIFLFYFLFFSPYVRNSGELLYSVKDDGTSVWRIVLYESPDRWIGLNDVLLKVKEDSNDRVQTH